MNDLDVNNLRIEIAVLQEEVNAFKPGRAKFKIPVLMTENTVASINTPNSNILNRRNGNIQGAPMNLTNVIELDIPLEYTIFYGSTVIPKNTRFMVSFVSGNINNMKIVGMYDKFVPEDGQEVIDFEAIFKSMIQFRLSDIDDIKTAIDEIKKEVFEGPPDDVEDDDPLKEDTNEGK